MQPFYFIYKQVSLCARWLYLKETGYNLDTLVFLQHVVRQGGGGAHSRSLESRAFPSREMIGRLAPVYGGNCRNIYKLHLWLPRGIICRQPLISLTARWPVLKLGRALTLFKRGKMQQGLVSFLATVVGATCRTDISLQRKNGIGSFAHVWNA